MRIKSEFQEESSVQLIIPSEGHLPLFKSQKKKNLLYALNQVQSAKKVKSCGSVKSLKIGYKQSPPATYPQ